MIRKDYQNLQSVAILDIKSKIFIFIFFNLNLLFQVIFKFFKLTANLYSIAIFQSTMAFQRFQIY